MLTLVVVASLRLHGHLSVAVHFCPQPQFNCLTEVLGDLESAGYARMVGGDGYAQGGVAQFLAI